MCMCPLSHIVSPALPQRRGSEADHRGCTAGQVEIGSVRARLMNLLRKRAVEGRFGVDLPGRSRLSPRLSRSNVRI